MARCAVGLRRFARGCSESAKAGRPIQRILKNAALPALAIAGSAAFAHAAPCSSLRELRLPHTTVLSAARLDSGTFRKLPALCRVRLVSKPTPDSRIGIEVWMPASRWNGRYVGVGNGSWGGSFNYQRLDEALIAGYATSSTDTGHRGAPRDKSWAEGHPEKQIDFDYRATHETALTAKAVIRRFYGQDAAHSYFNSCSNGGRQGLMEAERYPADYEGILSGAPALVWGFDTFVRGDLQAFEQRGGKLVIYHGGLDKPETSTRFYTDVRTTMGDSTVRGFFQLYVIPGMRHCGGGGTPSDVGQTIRASDDADHSLFKALERWVEQGIRPEGVTASRFRVEDEPSSGVTKTRRLRPYSAVPSKR